MSPFICGRCEKRVDDPYKRFERRVEFRSTRTQARYKVLLDAHLCKGCVDAEVAEARPRSDQGQLI